jgi:hypothetical protein
LFPDNPHTDHGQWNAQGFGNLVGIPGGAAAFRRIVVHHVTWALHEMTLNASQHDSNIETSRSLL